MSVRLWRPLEEDCRGSRAAWGEPEVVGGGEREGESGPTGMRSNAVGQPPEEEAE